MRLKKNYLIFQDVDEMNTKIKSNLCNRTSHAVPALPGHRGCGGLLRRLGLERGHGLADTRSQCELFPELNIGASFSWKWIKIGLVNTKTLKFKHKIICQHFVQPLFIILISIL
jgi:hypothetical protein